MAYLTCWLDALFTELPLGALATGMGLLQLPRMPELKGRTVTDFTPADVDLNAVPYRSVKLLGKFYTFTSYGRYTLSVCALSHTSISCYTSEQCGRYFDLPLSVCV